MSNKLTDEQLQEIYGEAVSCEVAEKNGAYMASFDLLCKMDDVGGTAYTVRKLIDMLRAERVELQERRKADSVKPACYALTNMAGEVYNTHSSAQNAEAYRDLVHQSDDSLTLRVTPLYAAPQFAGLHFSSLAELAAAISAVRCFDELSAELIAEEMFKNGGAVC